MRHGLWSVGLSALSLTMVLLFQNCSHIGLLEKRESEVRAIEGLRPSEFLLNDQNSLPNDISACEKNSGKLLDLVLNVTSLERGDSAEFDLGLINQGPVIATNSRQLRFRALSPGTLRDLTLRLGSTGSFVLFEDNSLAEIAKTQSKDDGIQIVLTKPVEVEAGKTYDLTLEFDLQNQIRQRSRGCVFSPKIHLSKVTSTSNGVN